MSVTEWTRFRDGTFWVRVATIVWTVLLGVIAVRSLLQPDSHDCYKPFYEPAGLNWLHGQDLYQLKSATCRYSPLVNAFFAPLALLPTPVGAMIWRAINSVAFLGGLYWWLRVYAPPTWTRAHWSWVYLLVIPLAAPTINSAQANPLLTGLMLAGVAAAGRERWNWAAVFVAGACFLKIYPIALALLLIVTFPRRFTVRFLVAVAVGAALPFVMQNPWWVARQHVNWWISLCIDDRTQWAPEIGYRDLWLLIRFYKLPISYAGYTVIQLALAGAAALICMAARWRARRPKLEVLNTVMGLAACWMTICGPTTEGSGYILLAPTVAFTFLESWHLPRPYWVRGLLIASALCFTAAVLTCLTSRPSEGMAYGPHPLGGLFLMIAIAGEAIRRILAPPSAEEIGTAPAATARAA